jgi:hypothetical protein
MKPALARRRAWLLLELLSGLALAGLLISGRALEGAARAREEALGRRRQQAYFLARALAAELPWSGRPPRIHDRAVAEFVAVRRDLARLGVSPRARRSLEGLRVDVAVTGTGRLAVRVRGPGASELREAGPCP